MVGMSAAKRNAERSVREFRAVSLLSCNLPRKLRDELDGLLAAIPGMKVSELNALTDHTDRVIEDVRRHLGALAPSSDYVALVSDMERHPGQMLWMQKHVIETQLFSNLSAAMPRWPLFPPHLRLGIDRHGEWPDTLEWRLLEASLFESAALLWNDVLEAAVDDSRARGDDKIPGKRYRELKRSTIRAVFALLEGYLNGIAYDITLTTDVTSLSTGALEMLSERDDQGRARFKSLKEKLFGYPRLALNLEHSAVDERNEHVAYLLAHERELRDAFVHPTPRREPAQAMLREQTYYDFKQETVSELIDHAIGLIRYIDGLLDGRFVRVEIWIADRGADGKFAPSTFH
jgi:hypothetical protein